MTDCPPGMLQRCQRTVWLTLGICFSFHPICFRLLLPFWLLHISQAVTRLSLQQTEGLVSLCQADKRPCQGLRFGVGHHGTKPSLTRPMRRP